MKYNSYLGGINKMFIKIDAVIIWVDGSDEKWQNKRALYDHNINQNISRYRDWGLLKYWFRSLEENAPWINNVFFVTDNQIPTFLDTNNERLKIINHKDYLPEKFLPTFSSHAIEINLHRIKQLEEHFVYFNDDTFLNKKVKPSFFFKKSLPRYAYIERKFNKDNSFMGAVSISDMDLINRNVNKKNLFFMPWKIVNLRYGRHLLKNIPMMFRSSFGLFEVDHLPTPLLKSTINDVWNLERDVCEKTTSHKFRNGSDINQYIFKFYDLARGNFIPTKPNHGGYYLIDRKVINSIENDIISSKNNMICLNDNEKLTDEDFCYLRKLLIKSFEKRYPNKSSFEK